MDEINNLLQELNATEAKRRERIVKGLKTGQSENQELIEKIEDMAAHDPVEYVRTAAIAYLDRLGLNRIADPLNYNLAAKSDVLISLGTRTVLDNLAVESAKKRERVIRELSVSAVREETLVNALQTIAESDPVEYVREAARAKLKEAGNVVSDSNVPILLRQETLGETADKVVHFPVLIGLGIVFALIFGVYLVFALIR